MTPIFSKQFSDCNKIMKKSVIFLKIQILVYTKEKFDQNNYFSLYYSNVEETKI